MAAPLTQAPRDVRDRVAHSVLLRDALAGFLPLEVRLVPATDNPEPGHQDLFDTWGEEDVVHLGVPEGASEERVLEMLWSLRLLAAGWPDPLEARAPVGRLRRRLLTAAARWWCAQEDALDLDGVREDIRDLLGRLGADDEDGKEAVSQAFCLACLGGEISQTVLTQIRRLDPEMAVRLEALLGQVDRPPVTPEEAADAEVWLLGTA